MTIRRWIPAVAVSAFALAAFALHPAEFPALFSPAAACTPQPSGVFKLDPPDGGTAATNDRILVHENRILLDATSMVVAIAGSSLAGTFSTISGDDEFFGGWKAFVPDAAFPPGATVTVVVGSGLTITPLSETFTVGAEPDTIPPTGGGNLAVFSETGDAPDLVGYGVTFDAGSDYLLLTFVETAPDGSVSTRTHVVEAGDTAWTVANPSIGTCGRTVAKGTAVHATAVPFDRAGNTGASSMASATIAGSSGDCRCALAGARAAPTAGGALASVLGVVVLLVRRRR